MFEVATTDIADLLRRADQVARHALLALANQPARPVGTSALEAGLLDYEARALFRAAELLRRMPAFRTAVRSGLCSASQAKGISRELRHARAAHLSDVDAFIGKRAAKLRAAEPERLVYEVGVFLSTLRNDVLNSREERTIRSSFLSLQPRLDGGGALYGEADGESFASICEALDSAAATPSVDTSRAKQRMDALVGICEASLGGGADRLRPKARVLVTLDADSGAAFLHGRVRNRPTRLSAASTDTLLCDADLLPVRFEDERPVSVGASVQTVPDRTRTAVAARDGGCRFPSCHAPIAWSDCHHITLRSAGGGHDVDNLVLLCREHHRLVHTKRWVIAHRADGGISFGYRGTSAVSYPRARFPALE